MTLLERLKPQFKPALKRESEKYPYLVEGIINHLEEEIYVHNIKFGMWIEMKFIFKTDSPYELFEEL